MDKDGMLYFVSPRSYETMRLPKAEPQRPGGPSGSVRVSVVPLPF